MSWTNNSVRFRNIEAMITMINMTTKGSTNIVINKFSLIPIVLESADMVSDQGINTVLTPTSKRSEIASINRSTSMVVRPVAVFIRSRL